MDEALPGLMPLFAPSLFFESGKWPGPHEIMELPGLGLTWSIEQPGQAMLYLDGSTAQGWAASGLDWREESMKNLIRRSASQLATAEFWRGGMAKELCYALAFMHEDGYGPSRLLLEDSLRRVFPAGYAIALPEMSCGLAVSLQASAAEREKIEVLVETCFREATRPLVAGIHDPSLLTFR